MNRKAPVFCPCSVRPVGRASVGSDRHDLWNHHRRRSRWRRSEAASSESRSTNQTDRPGGTANPDGSGHYSIGSLSAGTYFVRVNLATGYAMELHDNLPCIASDCPTTAGTPVVLADGGSATVNFALAPEGRIAGTVSLTGSGPLPGASVSIYNASTSLVKSVTADGAGAYVANGLAAGNYFVRVGSELYNDKPCFLSCMIASGTPVAVTAGATTSGIDIALPRGGSISGTVVAEGSYDAARERASDGVLRRTWRSAVRPRMRVVSSRSAPCRRVPTAYAPASRAILPPRWWWPRERMSRASRCRCPAPEEWPAASTCRACPRRGVDHGDAEGRDLHVGGDLGGRGGERSGVWSRPRRRLLSDFQFLDVRVAGRSVLSGRPRYSGRSVQPIFCVNG